MTKRGARKEGSSISRRHERKVGLKFRIAFAYQTFKPAHAFKYASDLGQISHAFHRPISSWPEVPYASAHTTGDYYCNLLLCRSAVALKRVAYVTARTESLLFTLIHY